MVWFLLTFLSIYTAMNAVVYYKARLLLPERWGVQAFVVLFFVLMIAAPIGIRLIERSGYEGPARVLAYLGYSWMGFVFVSLCGFLAVEAVGLVFKLVNVFTGAGLPPLTGRGGAGAVFVAALLTCCYGYMEARWIKVERSVLKTTKLPEGVDRLKIAQVSDVHMGLLNGKELLQPIVALMRAEQPDLVVATGDVVDGDMVGNGEIHELWQQLQPPLGKYAVTGNHEYYAGLAQALQTIERCGFRVLRDETLTSAGVLNIVGVDDPTGGSLVDEAALLASSRNALFTLLLKHRPEVREQSRGLFDLQLSGHAHRGQIFPFRFFTGMAYPMQNGLYDLGGGSFLYTSRGAGTWGPPMRVLSPPEVTIIELIRQLAPEL
jgi:uncharacterized protein